MSAEVGESDWQEGECLHIPLITTGGAFENLSRSKLKKGAGYLVLKLKKNQ